MSTSAPRRPLEVFFAYSHADEAWRDKLELHLAPLKRNRTLATWHDRRILAGEEWRGRIDRQLASADIVLLLISKNFLGSDFCRSEMERALDRHHSGDAVVIPILLRPCHWELDLGNLQALPKDNLPVVSWSERDAALLEVVKGIESAIQERAGGKARTEPVPDRSNPTSRSGVDFVGEPGKLRNAELQPAERPAADHWIHSVWEPGVISRAFRRARPNETIGIAHISLHMTVPTGYHEPDSGHGCRAICALCAARSRLANDRRSFSPVSSSSQPISNGTPNSESAHQTPISVE